jgi:predicted molibdopterin-dependent oxidoreductase YjgC
MDAPLFETETQRSQEIEKLLTANHVLSWPDEYLEVRRVVDEPDDEFTIPVFVTDDTHHCGHLTEKAASLVNFQGEAYVEMSHELADRHDVADGDSVRVESHVGKVILPVKVSRILEGDVVLIPRNFISAPVTSLLMRKRRLDRIKISKVAD